MVAPSHGERPPLHVVPSTSPVALNWCSTQHAGTSVGTGEGWKVGTPVGWAENVGTVEGWEVGTPVGRKVCVGSGDGGVVGTEVGTFVGAAVGDVGTALGNDVGASVGAGDGGSGDGGVVGIDVGTFVGAADGMVVSVVGAADGTSSSRRAPSRRPLDRRAVGPLRGEGGRCPHANALSSKHRRPWSMVARRLGAAPTPLFVGRVRARGLRPGLPSVSGEAEARSNDATQPVGPGTPPSARITPPSCRSGDPVLARIFVPACCPGSIAESSAWPIAGGGVLSNSKRVFGVKY